MEDGGYESGERESGFECVHDATNARVFRELLLPLGTHVFSSQLTANLAKFGQNIGVLMVGERIAISAHPRVDALDQLIQ